MFAVVGQQEAAGVALVAVQTNFDCLINSLNCCYGDGLDCYCQFVYLQSDYMS
jgi:hypothetical protein